jgi:hypothetical protein
VNVERRSEKAGERAYKEEGKEGGRREMREGTKEMVMIPSQRKNQNIPVNKKWYNQYSITT